MTLKAAVAKMCAAGAMALTIGFAAAPADAAILVDQSMPYSGHYVGGTDWTKFTTSLDTLGGGYVVGSLGDASAVAAADALIINARYDFDGNNQFSDAELANVLGFLETGKRVLIVGEGAPWYTNWNGFVFDLVTQATGQTASNGGMGASGAANPFAGFELTNGVGAFNMEGAGLATGGTALFDKNFATLWAPNLLTVLDFNAFKDNPSPAFRDNMASWLGASSAVPEPSTWAMMILGFGLVGSSIRRRSTGAKPA